MKFQPRANPGGFVTQPYVQQPTQYTPPPAKKSHTVRNVLLGVTLLLVLVIGGCLALIGGVANEVDKAIKEDANKDGGTDNPMPIKEGEAFEVDGFKYAAGWSANKDGLGDVEIKGLKVTNERDSKDSAFVEIKFWKGTEVLALVDCSTQPIATGTTVTLNCFSGDDMPKAYDKVTINDSY